MEHTPVALTWTVTNLVSVKKGHFTDYKCNRQGPYYYCQCEWAYRGNPYIFKGCKGIDSSLNMYCVLPSSISYKQKDWIQILSFFKIIKFFFCQLLKKTIATCHMDISTATKGKS